MENRSLSVPDGLAGERVDAAIAKLLGFSRTFAAEVAEGGGVVARRRVLGKSDRLTAGGWLEVSWESKAEPVIVPDRRRRPQRSSTTTTTSSSSTSPSASRLIRRSAGTGRPCSAPSPARASASRPRVPPSARASCTASTRARAASWSWPRPSARTPSSSAQFHDREVDKIYHAVVQGHPDPLAGTIDAPIGRHPGASWKFAVTADGKPSVTHYETLEAFPSASLLEIHLETGRTHQIRVHMAAQRHPCVGDAMYGADPTISRATRARRGSGCTPCGWASASDDGRVRASSRPSTRPTFNTLLTCFGGD